MKRIKACEYTTLQNKAYLGEELGGWRGSYREPYLWGKLSGCLLAGYSVFREAYWRCDGDENKFI